MSKKVAVYCGASLVEPRYINLAYAVGVSIAKNNWSLVSGCSTLGMMGACADGAISANGRTKGITLKKFKNFHNGFDEIVSVVFELLRIKKKKRRDFLAGEHSKEKPTQENNSLNENFDDE